MGPALPASMPRWIAGALLALVVLPFYRWCWNIDAPDLSMFLVPWYRHIVAAGRWHVFAAPFGDYSPPYLYMLSMASSLDGLVGPATAIRLLSLAITGLLAVALTRILRMGQMPADGALLLFAMPSVIVNAAMLGQCDALWAAACLMAVGAAIRLDPAPMLAWCGVAFAIKAQAIFIAPFALGTMLALRPRWYFWLIPAAACLACMAPALAAGWPVGDLLTVYLRQSGEYARINNGAANFWLLPAYAGQGEAPLGFALAYALALLAGVGCCWTVIRASRSTLTTADRLALALLPALATPFVLPMMHERYFFLADILSLALALVARSPRAVLIAGATQLGSVLALFAYITGESVVHLHSPAGLGPLGTMGVLANTVALAATAFWVWPLAVRSRISRQRLQAEA